MLQLITRLKTNVPRDSWAQLEFLPHKMGKKFETSETHKSHNKCIPPSLATSSPRWRHVTLETQWRVCFMDTSTRSSAMPSPWRAPSYPSTFMTTSSSSSTSPTTWTCILQNLNHVTLSSLFTMKISGWTYFRTQRYIDLGVYTYFLWRWHFMLKLVFLLNNHTIEHRSYLTTSVFEIGKNRNWFNL